MGAVDFVNFNNIAAPASSYLVARIPEISYLLSTILMVFASDFIMEHFLLRGLKGRSFISRTFLFLLYGLLVLPAFTAGGAYLLRAFVLNPYKEWIIVILLLFFFVTGILLSIRYNMRIRFKGR